MNKALLKNALIVFLLAVTGFSVFKYASSLREKYGLLHNLGQVKEDNLVLVKQKQNLLQDLDKENKLKLKFFRENSELREYLRSGKSRLTKLFNDYAKEQRSLKELSARFSLLKAENSSLSEEKQKVNQENLALKNKLNSITELKKAIKELKRNMRNTQAGLIIIDQVSKPITPKIVEGNCGFLVKDGKFTSPGKVVIEVIPAPPKRIMKEIFDQFVHNRILLVTLLAWIIAQTIKVTTGVVRQKKFDFRWFVGTGGMPSSHAAGASCLAASVGFEYGFDSIYFALAASFAIVVMFDAQGVRRATGKQARILNKITDDIYWQGKMHEGRLRELIGHTPLEVVAGFLLGALIALSMRSWLAG